MIMNRIFYNHLIMFFQNLETRHNLYFFFQFGDSQSMHNYRSGADNHSMVNQFEDEVSLRSLPMPAQHGSCMPSGPQGGNGNGVGGPSGTGSAAHSLGGQQADQRSLHSTHVHMSNLNPPRSMSPVSNFSGDELSHGGRRSQRRRPLLDKQVSKFSRFFLIASISSYGL